MAIISNADFEDNDIIKMISWSPLEEVYEKEHSSSGLLQLYPSINMPIFEKKRLPFNLNLKPRTWSPLEEVYEKEHPSSALLQLKPSINIPIFEKKRLPFNLNLKPRTYGRPRSSPIDIHALLPCRLHKRKLEQRDEDINDPGELEFTRIPKKMKLIIRLKPPEVPLEYKEKMAELGGSDLRFVIQKKLHKSDVKKNKGRLSMPYKKCMVDFGEIGEMKVKVYQQANKLNEMNMIFTRSCSRSCYVLTGSWNDIVEANHLQVGDVVQVWSFRQDDELSFALLKL